MSRVADRPANAPVGAGLARAALGLRRSVPEGRWLLLFLGPYLFGFAVLIAVPVVESLGGSLSDWPLFGDPTLSGLGNYQKLLQSPSFWQAFLNTVYYVALLVPLEIVCAIGLALLVNRGLPGRTLFRSVYFAPFVMSLASIGLVWTWLFSPDYGLVDQALSTVRLPQIRWLAEPGWAMPALVITSVWRNCGYYMVIFLAGLQSVPEELHEAARIDGAGAWNRFRHVTWPALTPTTFFAVIIGVILGFQVFDLSFIMTQGGPSSATTTLVYLIYTTAFQRGDLGYASAIAFALLVITLLFTLVYFRFERRWVHYAA